MTAAAGMKIVTRKLDALVADPANVRRHPKKNLQAIADSLKRFGQTEPLVVRKADARVIGGNGRLEVMRELGWKDAKVVELDISSTDATALGIALNRTSDLATWAEDELAKVLRDLMDQGEIEGTGWTEEEAGALCAAFAPPQEDGGDEIPDEGEAAGPPVTRPGDVWVIGDSIVACGDCRDPGFLRDVLGGTRINVAVTSPPYAAQREYDQHTEFRPIPPGEYVEWFAPVAANVAEHLAEDGSWFVNIKEHCEDGQRHLYVRDLTLAHARDWGWRFVEEYIWVHGGTPKAVNQRFKNGWEPIFQFTRSNPHKFRPDAVAHAVDAGNIPDWSGEHPSHEKHQGGGKLRRTNAKQAFGDNQGKPGGGTAIAQSVMSSSSWKLGVAYPSNVISAGKNREALGHPAAYPPALPRFFVLAFSDKGDTIFDPFLGSGSTLCAAHVEGRRGVGVEISPMYADIAVRRLIAMGAGEPVRKKDRVKWSTAEKKAKKR